MKHQYLSVGNPTIDVDAAGRRRPGGSSLFGALQAACWGLEATAYGRAEPSELLALLDEVTPPLDLEIEPAGCTTTFVNTETGLPFPSRRQRVLASAGEIASWPQGAAEILHLAPVLDELGTDDIASRRGDFTLFTPQGALRRLTRHGHVELVPSRIAPSAFRCIDLLVISDFESTAGGSMVDAVIRGGGLVVETSGANGSRASWKGGQVRVGSVPVVAVDPTGAGDTFAVVLAIELHRGTPLRSALHLAAAGGAYCATGLGLSSIATRGQAQELVFQSDF